MGRKKGETIYGRTELQKIKIESGFAKGQRYYKAQKRVKDIKGFYIHFWLNNNVKQLLNSLGDLE